MVFLLNLLTNKKNQDSVFVNLRNEKKLLDSVLSRIFVFTTAVVWQPTSNSVRVKKFRVCIDHVKNIRLNHQIIQILLLLLLLVVVVVVVVVVLHCNLIKTWNILQILFFQTQYYGSQQVLLSQMRCRVCNNCAKSVGLNHYLCIVPYALLCWIYTYVRFILFF